MIVHDHAQYAHCYREANQLADWLAKLTMNAQVSNLYFSDQQPPHGAKGTFLIDKNNVPSFRTKYDKSFFFFKLVFTHFIVVLGNKTSFY